MKKFQGRYDDQWDMAGTLHMVVGDSSHFRSLGALPWRRSIKGVQHCTDILPFDNEIMNPNFVLRRSIAPQLHAGCQTRVLEISNKTRNKTVIRQPAP